MKIILTVNLNNHNEITLSLDKEGLIELVNSLDDNKSSSTTYSLRKLKNTIELVEKINNELENGPD